MVDWSTVVVLGGAMGFSKGLNQSGAVTLITDKLLILPIIYGL